MKPLYCLLFPALLAAQIPLVRNGKASGAIVIPGGAAEAVRAAATELQTYVQKISQARLPIHTEAQPKGIHCIYLTRAADLPREAFRIKTADGNLTLAASDDAGIQFAVYTFLEDYLGVRWFWPGELGEVVPRQRSIVIGSINLTQQPDFKWRNRGPGGALWGASTGPTEMRARERLLGVSARHQAEVALWEKHNKWGGMKIYGGHSLGEIFPPQKYARTHPDYYALVNGKRAVPGPDYDYKHGGQVCTTNPGVIRATVEWVRDFFDRHPDFDAVHITPNDSGGFCECDRCRALDSGELLRRAGIDAEETKKAAAKNTVITDRIFTFVNQVAEQVQKTHPGKYVACMAYGRYITPPSKIQLHPSVIPQYCLWSAYRHANPGFKQEHETIAAAWARAARRAGIYEYHINGSWPGLHRLVMPYIAESIQYLHRQGIDLYQTQSGDDFAVNGLNYYIAGKLLWNTSGDPQKILDDFYAKAFAGAGPAVKRFHQRLQDAWTAATRDGRDVTCNSLADTRLLELFTPELLEKSAQDLSEAEKAAPDDLVRRRVQFYRQGLRYTELTVAAVRAARNLELRNSRQLAQALAAWERREKFVEDLKDDYVVAYFWVAYNNAQRNFNPIQRLRELSKELAWNRSQP